jgi:alpha-glucosidase/alpha-D-xyloside xylohydrolase
MNNINKLISSRICVVLLLCAANGSVVFGQSKIIVAGNASQLLLTPVSNQTVRVTILPLDAKNKAIPLKKDLVIEDEWGKPALNSSVIKSGTNLQLNNIRVTIGVKPLTLSFYNSRKKLFQKLVFNERNGEVDFYTGKEPLLGLGGGGQAFDRRGTYDEMQEGFQSNEYQLFGSRVPIPFLIGTEGWSIFFHLPYKGAFDLRKGTTGKFIPRTAQRAAEEAPLPLDIFVTNDDTPGDAVAAYATITGKTPLPPKWAFGYMQSHRTLGNQASLLEEAKTFREKQLPCDVMIYLGTGYAPTGWNLGHASMDFNPAVFTKPDEIIHRELCMEKWSHR